MNCNFPSFLPCGSSNGKDVVGGSIHHNKEREQFMKRFPKRAMIIPSLEEVENIIDESVPGGGRGNDDDNGRGRLLW